MSVGEKKTLNIPFDKAYGPRNPEMVIDFPKERLPEEMTLEVGMQLMMSNGAGQQIPVQVVEVKEEVIVLDANHMLAGHDLVFDIELVEIVGGKPLIITP